MSTWSPEHDQNQNKTQNWEISVHVNVLLVLIAHILNSHAASPSITVTTSLLLQHICGGGGLCLARDVRPSCWCPSAFFLCCSLVMCCTYRLQRRAASVRVAGCGGATRPAVGGSDWGCWDCAAASRMGCPSGLAVGGDTQPHTAEHGDSNTQTQTCNKRHEATQQDREMWTRRGDKTDKKQEREGEWREGGRGQSQHTRSSAPEVKEAKRIAGKAETPVETHEEERDTWRRK